MPYSSKALRLFASFLLILQNFENITNNFENVTSTIVPNYFNIQQVGGTK